MAFTVWRPSKLADADVQRPHRLRKRQAGGEPEGGSSHAEVRVVQMDIVAAAEQTVHVPPKVTVVILVAKRPTGNLRSRRLLFRKRQLRVG